MKVVNIMNEHEKQMKALKTQRREEKMRLKSNN